jgi:signal peptidase I
VWREWVRPLLVTALVLGSFRSAVADWNDVPTGSMKPTILEGDRIFVNKMAYDLKVPFTTWRIAEWATPQRGDIVVLFSPYDGKRLVKRLVAVPGDRVELRNNKLYVNGHAARYEPADVRTLTHHDPGSWAPRVLAQETADGQAHLVLTNPEHPTMPWFGPVTLPEGRYFVMGDNRDDSFDSRWFGSVERSRIVGRATAVVVSLDLDRSWRPRWWRFFSRLG